MRFGFPRPLQEQKSKNTWTCLSMGNSFEDSYRQATVEESFLRKHPDEGRQLLKEQADANYSAGSVGRDAVH